LANNCANMAETVVFPTPPLPLTAIFMPVLFESKQTSLSHSDS
jgi:hypothetical protein